MIKNEMKNESRAAKITTLDDTLNNNETEYLFLFKTLNDFLESNCQDIATTYPIPNIARKFWESFLVFFIPSNQGMYKRMDVLKEEGVDPQKIDAIYRFTNDQSHITGEGVAPSLVPEAIRVIDNIFSVIEEVAPRHYQHLKNMINSA